MDAKTKTGILPVSDRKQNLRTLISAGTQADLYNDPRFRSALKGYAQTGDDMLYEYLLRWCHSIGFAKGQLYSDRFELPFYQGEIPGEIPIGRIVDTDLIYKIGVDDLTRHAFIAGAPGTGKTVFLCNLLLPIVKSRIKTIFIDPKGGDFNVFIPHGVIYLKWHDLCFNVLRPPKNFPQELWNPRLSEALSEALGLLIASFGTLEGYIRQTQQRYQGKIEPCFKELADEVHRDSKGNNKREMYRQTVESRMDTVNSTLSKVFWYRRGFMDELMEQSFILDISELTGVAQQILVEVLLAYVYAWHMANVPKIRDQKLVRVVCIDEAQHTVMNIGKSRGARPASTGIEQAIALSREKGLGFIASAQSPSKVLPEILNDAHLRATFNLGSSTEIRIMGYALGLNKQQAEMVQHLKVGMAVMQRSSGYTYPSLLQCFQANLREPTDEDWRRNEERVKNLQKLAEPCNSDDEQLPMTIGMKLSEKAQKFLIALGENPITRITDLTALAGLASGSGNTVKTQLIKDGYIQERALPGSGSGASKIAWLTPAGIQAYKNITNKNPKQMIKTKWAREPHDWWCNKVAAYYHHRGHRFQIGKSCGQQEADVWVEVNGETVVYEVTLTLKNVPQKLDLLHYADRLVYLCENKQKCKEVGSLAEVPNELEHRVNFMILKAFLF